MHDDFRSILDAAGSFIAPRARGELTLYQNSGSPADELADHLDVTAVTDQVMPFRLFISLTSFICRDLTCGKSDIDQGSTVENVNLRVLANAAQKQNFVYRLCHDPSNNSWCGQLIDRAVSYNAVANAATLVRSDFLKD